MVVAGGAYGSVDKENGVRTKSEPASTGFRMRLSAAALALGALAAIALTMSSGQRGDQLMGNVLLEESKSDYLGDTHALSSVDARKQADSMFSEMESKKRLHKKFWNHHHLKHGMSSKQARDDLSSFFDTLGLTGDDDSKKKEHSAKVDVHTKTVQKADNRKTIVNVYINADKDKKEVAKPKAKESGVPIPLATKARKVQLSQQSEYQREMAEARKLLGASKIEKALAQARTLSLKSEAPYYTS